MVPALRNHGSIQPGTCFAHCGSRAAIGANRKRHHDVLQHEVLHKVLGEDAAHLRHHNSATCYFAAASRMSRGVAP
jgi:hypothetical protein